MVAPTGGHNGRGEPSALEFLEELTDGTFEEWAREVVSDDPLKFVGREPYGERLADLQRADPNSEAIRVGFAVIGGHDVALICSDFGFLAGTIGIAAAERIARLFIVATSFGRPVVGICRSGGTRMQEGTPAFVAMLSIAAAVSEHREAGLAFITYLMHPSMGGALASWGTQGQVVWAQAGAGISLTGPRVVEVVTGEKIPVEQISAETALRHGLVDDVFDLDEFPGRLRTCLDLLSANRFPVDSARPGGDVCTADQTDPWYSIMRSRDPDRPAISDVLACADSALITLRGDRTGLDDPGLTAGITSLVGHPCIVAGFVRPDGRGAQVSPAGYRKASRVIALADELELPFVSFLDTRGAGTGPAVEQSGLADIVGRLLRQLLSVRVPTVSVLMGEGSGAGALALLPADAVLALEHGWLAPIAPEAGSAILFRSPDEAALMARGQWGETAALHRLGVVQEVVRDRGQPATSAQAIVDAVGRALDRLSALDVDERLATRRVGTRSVNRELLTIRVPE